MTWDPIESAKSHKGLIIRNGKYWWKQLINGKRYHESLNIPVAGRSEERLALRVLKSKRNAVTEGRVSDYEQMAVKRRASSIGDVFKAYEKYSRRRKMRSKWEANAQALRRIVARAKGIPLGTVDALGLDVLTASLMLTFEDNALSGEHGAVLSVNSICSYRQKARSLFTKGALHGYSELAIPESVSGFCAAGDVKRDVRSWRRAPSELVKKTKEAARKLQENNEQTSIQAIWVLCYGLGLRCNEAANIKWHWFEEYEGQRVAWIIKRPDEWTGPKSIDGFVPVPDAVWEWLQKLRRPGDPFVLEGISDYDRYFNKIQRDFAKWLHDLGWPAGKGAHALRRQRGSEWWDDPEVGPMLASAWLRHSSIKVTETHYGKAGVPDKSRITIDF